MGMLATIGGIFAIAAEQGERSTFFRIVGSVLENVLAMDLLSGHTPPEDFVVAAAARVAL